MTAFRIYGRPVTTNIEDDTPLLWVIRDVIGLTGTKFGCGIGMCGALCSNCGSRLWDELVALDGTRIRLRIWGRNSAGLTTY
jgi:aerobic-type carbon monoxide dehydrogenase small subunit (CoxS/CutS family)